MRRAWETMNLAGIYCVDRVPTIYFKEVKSINRDQIRNLHRKLWNQGTATMLVVVSDTEACVYSAQVLPSGPDESNTEEHSLVETLHRTADLLQGFLHRVQ